MEEAPAEKNKGGRPLKFKTVEELDKKIDAYFESCWEQKIDMFGNPIFQKNRAGEKDYDKPVMVQVRPYTMTGLAVELNTDRKTLLNYKNNMRYFPSIKRALQKCQAYAESSLFVGKNPSGAIFNLKNNYEDWEDKQIKKHEGKLIILDE